MELAVIQKRRRIGVDVNLIHVRISVIGSQLLVLGEEMSRLIWMQLARVEAVEVVRAAVISDNARMPCRQWHRRCQNICPRRGWHQGIVAHVAWVAHGRICWCIYTEISGSNGGEIGGPIRSAWS